MTWPVFPASIPITIQLRQSVESTSNTQKLGDGYAYVTQFGLNPIKESWRVSIFVDQADLQDLTAFLEERAMDGLPFEWTPPDGNPMELATVPTDAAIKDRPWLWSVDQWPTSRNERGRVAVDVVFRRRFDQVIEIQP